MATRCFYWLTLSFYFALHKRKYGFLRGRAFIKNAIYLLADRHFYTKICSGFAHGCSRSNSFHYLPYFRGCLLDGFACRQC